MSEWTMKRFWTAAHTDERADGFTVMLDAREIRTPAKAPLILPTRGLADAIAAEWDAQGDVVDPGTMPITRTANSAIDKVVPQRDEVIATLAEYGATDLLSYRADGPDALVARQAEAWDPMLDWAARTHDARLVATAGIMPVAQDPQALVRLAAPMTAMSPFEIAAFHDLVALTGSLVLATALSDGAADPENVWAMSRIDEDWQAEEWGRDDEAEEVAGRKRRAFLDAHRFLILSRGAGV